MAKATKTGWGDLVARPPVVVVVLVSVFFAFSYRFFLLEGNLPLHDTGFFFQVFKTTYSNFFFTGELPEWLAQGVFGYQTHFQNILGLSPMSYLVMVAGKIFGILDTLFLFKAVILLEVSVFGLGFLRLAGEFFEDRRIAVLALAPFLLTIIIINQITFMFRIVYLVPLMTYFMLGFFKTGKVWKLVMAGVVVFVALFGTNVYFVVYYAIYGAVFCVAFFVAGRKNFSLGFDLTSVLVAVAALFFAGLCSYLVLTSIDGLTFAVTGRDPDTFKVSLDTFLNFGGGGFVKMFELLVAAPLGTRSDPLAILDVTFYVPAAVVVFAVYAFFREKDRLFLALAFVFVVMLALTWGRYSPVAYALYYIPGVSYLRHLGLLLVLPKVLLCLIAGFGIQRIVNAAAAGAEAFDKERRFLAQVAQFAALALTAILGATIFVAGTLDWDSPRAILLALSAAGFVVIAVTVSKPNLKIPALLAVIAAVIVVQGGVYSIRINTQFSNGYVFSPIVKEEISRARIFPFDETRPVISAHPRHDLWRAFKPGKNFFINYMILYGSLGLDLCYPVVPDDKVDYFSPGVGDLVRHLFGPDADTRFLIDFHKKSPDAVFFRLAGCSGRSKLQLITRYEEDILKPSASVAAADMASAVLVERPDTRQRRLVRSVAGEYPNATSLSAQGISITDFSANRLAATVKIAGPDGAWLVYADGFHPGWRATLNGKPLPVWKANMAFKAVYLPPGVNAVVFDFAHWGWQWAMWLVAFVSVAVIVLGSVWPIKKPEKG